jgi:dephospho-CoA kinase
MKELILGPSGSGKTYISSELRRQGVNAVDADTIDGLSSWYNANGDKVTYPENADEEFLDNHSFLWNREFLKGYLNNNSDIYLFGVAGNVFDVLDLFDKVYYLKVAPETQRERLMHGSRENPMGSTEYQRDNAIIWAQEIEEKAKELKIPFIDASLTPKEILSIFTHT